MWLLSTCRMDLSLETRAGGTHRVSFGTGWPQQPSPRSSGGCPALTPGWWPLGDPLGTVGLVLALQTVQVPVTHPLERHQLQGLLAEQVVVAQVNLHCRERGLSAQLQLLSRISKELGLCLLSCGHGKGGEERSGAVPRKPMATRQARVSTTARTRIPTLLKDSGALEDLGLVQGPATQRSVALHGRAQPGTAHLPQLPAVLPLPSSRSEAESCKAERKTSYELEVQAQNSWEAGGPDVVREVGPVVSSQPREQQG